MIGFKKVPTKLVLSAFFISIIFILLLYTDIVLNKPLPEEEIKITKNFDDPLPIIKNKLMHQVRKGESLSVIFEEKKVPDFLAIFKSHLSSKILIFEKNPFTTAVSILKRFHLTPFLPTFEIHQ